MVRGALPICVTACQTVMLSLVEKLCKVLTVQDSLVLGIVSSCEARFVFEKNETACFRSRHFTTIENESVRVQIYPVLHIVFVPIVYCLLAKSLGSAMRVCLCLVQTYGSQRVPDRAHRAVTCAWIYIYIYIHIYIYICICMHHVQL